MELVLLKQLFQRLSNDGRLLGLDVGSRNIGLAVFDPKCRVPLPHSVLYRSNTTTLKNIRRLECLVEEMNIKGLVIGYPLELTGFRGAQVKLFAKELQLSGRFPNVAYVYWDERLTSVVPWTSEDDKEKISLTKCRLCVSSRVAWTVFRDSRMVLMDLLLNKCEAGFSVSN